LPITWPKLIRLSAITPRPTQRFIPSSPRYRRRLRPWRRLATLMPVAEPSLLLLAPAHSTLRGVVGDADPFHALGFRLSFVPGGVEAGVSGDQTWKPSQPRFMRVDRRDQQVSIAGPLLVDLVIDDLCAADSYVESAAGM
jgi:hypothetical protein